MQRLQQTSAPSDASRTITITPTPSEPSTSSSSSTNNPAGVLRLRGRAMPGVKVQWDEEVVDNEGLGRKKSKICCIYHKPKAFDESSGDESDSSCGSTDSRGRHSQHNHSHPHHHPPQANGDSSSSGGGGLRDGTGGGGSTELEGDDGPAGEAEPNAYDSGPKGGKGSSGKGKGKLPP